MQKDSSYGHGESGDISTGYEPQEFVGFSGPATFPVQGSSYVPPSEVRRIDPKSAEGQAILAQLRADEEHRERRCSLPYCETDA